MRGGPSFLGLTLVRCGFFSLSAAALSCSPTPSTATASVKLVPTVVVPKNIVDEISVFSLQVYRATQDGGTLSCPSGTASGYPVGDVKDATGLLAKADVAATAGGACSLLSHACFTDVTLPQQTPLVFLVTGYADKAQTEVVAYGCASDTLATPDGGGNGTASVNITMVATESCGDGMLEPPETCDPTSADEECAACQTTFDLLSTGSGPSGSITTGGVVGDKNDPFFLWPSGGSFLAFFSDKTANAADSEQISMRVRDPSFAPSTVAGPITETQSIYVPNAPGVFPPAAEQFDHKQPVAVQTGGDTFVVFADDASTNYAIVLRAIDGTLNAVQTTPCTVSDSTAGESGILTSPSVAVSSVGGTDVLFIAWQDNAGRIYGRTYTPGASGACGTRGSQTLLSSSGNNSHVSVAALPMGWIVTWQDDSDIVVRPVGTTGEPTASAVPLGLGSTPTIASLPNGYAVVWSDKPSGSASTAIFAVRFSAGSVALDKTPVQVSQSSNNEATPVVAASPVDGGSYVVAWVDQSGDQEVRGRLLASSGSFLQNVIDGTTGEFIVSDLPGATTSGRTRMSPTVAVGGGTGGTAGYIAFGWVDATPGAADGTFGIFGRRFPLSGQ